MALPSVQHSNSKTLESTTPAGCQFEHESGAKCGLTKLLSRGYCARHYRQLERSGVFSDLANRDQSDHLVSINADRLLKAKDILEKSAPRLARHLIKASQIAAERGDHKPALAGLLHTRAIEDVEKSATPRQSTGVTIKVGVALAGLDSRSEAITIQADDVTDSTPLDKLEE